MLKMKHLLAATALTAASALSASAETWDMPLAYAATNFHSENAAEFATCVKDKTGGAMEIVTHPSGSLFAGNDIKRAIQTGQAPIGERLISAHQNENPMFGIDSIPFLATSFGAHEQLWDVAGPKVAEILAQQNLVYLYSVPWPPQGLYFKKPVESVADMKGIKFRSYSTATARMAELTGMLPVQVEAAELSQALATGVAESFISSGATGYDRKVWEHLTHFYEVDAWLPRNIVFANKDAWDGLSVETQSAMRDCAATAKANGLQRSKDYTQFTLDGLKAGGMTVGPAGANLVAELKAIGETMTAEWLESAGDEGRAVVDAYKAKN
ncbi:MULTISPECIES: TRAP transporter substrate-binding protein [Ruegeria]|uniref:TRAP transporter substrate-binding protein n=2 Tax=Ruegeria TaxID=97050 RepID=A0A6B2NLI5_9RHOB|nr:MULTISPECIES: TRAP transporter substrate-binding protein [unclassified Ruegeria]MCU9838731.1 TRAP transporter substrate-binding protein [Ruegeria sp. WL0004]NDW43853.1 TRAP transporter substrate-binding protein [Ruegeria sp. PrR005]